MNKIIVVLLLILIVGGVYVITQMPKQNAQDNTQTPLISPPVSNVPTVTASPSPIPNATGEQKKFAAVITYTDSGFTPASITIKNGETVKWINQSSAKMWVASNPHPTHTDYPGFDQLSSALSGGKYQFTFEKVGNWGYHNHTNPSDGGMINVQ